MCMHVLYISLNTHAFSERFCKEICILSYMLLLLIILTYNLNNRLIYLILMLNHLLYINYIVL